MKLLINFPFYILLFYPILGYYTHRVLKSPPFYFLFIMILISSFFTFNDIYRIKPIKFPSYLKYFGLFCLLEFFTKYIVNNVTIGLNGYIVMSLQYQVSFLILLIIENITFSRKFKDNSVKIMKYLIYFAAITSVIQYFNHSFIVNIKTHYGLDDNIVGYARRIYSIFTWGDHIGTRYFAVGLIIFYSIVLVENLGKTRTKILIIISVGIVVLLSQTRVAMVTYIISTLLLASSRFSFKNIIYIILLLLAIDLFINLINFDFDYFFTNRLQSDSVNTRIEAFYHFAEVFPQNPFWGTGKILTNELYKIYGRATRIHNGFLIIPFTYGIFAAFFYYLFLIHLGIRLYSTARKSKYYASFVGFICFITANFAVNINHFIEPGLVFMIIFNKYFDDRLALDNNLTISKSIKQKNLQQII